MSKRAISAAVIVALTLYIRRTTKQLLEEIEAGIGGHPPRPAKMQPARTPSKPSPSHFQAFRGTAAEQTV